MSEQTVIDIAVKTIFVLLKISAPALITALIAGLGISIIQAATQINEQTLSFIPKIIFMMIAFVVAGPWIIQTIMNFTVTLYESIPTIGR